MCPNGLVGNLFKFHHVCSLLIPTFSGYPPQQYNCQPLKRQSTFDVPPYIRDLTAIVGDLCNKLGDIQANVLPSLSNQVSELSTHIVQVEKRLDTAISPVKARRRCDTDVPPELSVSP